MTAFPPAPPLPVCLTQGNPEGNLQAVYLAGNPLSGLTEEGFGSLVAKYLQMMQATNTIIQTQLFSDP